MHAICIIMILGPFKADVHSLTKLKHECEKHKVCTNLGVAVYIYIYSLTFAHCGARIQSIYKMIKVY